MLFTKEELSEKSAFVLAAVRKEFPNFPEIDMSTHDALNAIVLEIEERRKIYASEWAKSFEAKKREFFEAGKIEGKRDTSGNITYGDIPPVIYDEIIDSISDRKDRETEDMKNMLGLESYFDLSELSGVRDKAETEFRMELNKRRKDSGDVFKMDYSEFVYHRIVSEHPNLFGMPLEEIRAEFDELKTKWRESAKRLSEARNRL